MRVLLLEPYCAGSHRAWAEGYARHSALSVSLLTLPGRWWKWRMHGAAVTLARLADTWRAANGCPDLFLATDMLNLATFLALTRRWSAGIPAALYMHENQLTYPLPANPAGGPMRRHRGERDLHYAFVNHLSMLAADAVFFNSRYHHDVWFAAVPNMLRRLPDFRELQSIDYVRARSSVMPLGIDLAALDAFPSDAGRSGGDPLILWNHRWEYDKDPAAFFHALAVLAADGLPFRVAVCGETLGCPPAAFEETRSKLGSRIVQWGPVNDLADYARLLWQSDLVVSTALHDFFGASVVEAVYCNCRPVLPHRLAYPEHVPPEHWQDCLYQGQGGLLALLRQALEQPGLHLRQAVSGYDWSVMAPRYDRALVALAGRCLN